MLDHNNNKQSDAAVNGAPSPAAAREAQNGHQVDDELARDFVSKLFMTKSKAVELRKNNSICQKLGHVLQSVTKSGRALDHKAAKLIIYWCSNVKSQVWDSSQCLLEYILSNKLASNSQIDYALDYLLNNVGSKIDCEKFEKHIGIGVEISAEQIAACVTRVISEMSAGNLNKSAIISKVNKELKFAKGLDVMNEVTKQLSAGDNKKPLANSKAKRGAASKAPSESSFTYADLFNDPQKFHKVGENFKTDRYVITPNTMKHLEAHKKRTGGQVVTRFPPEPSGILHIGHVKAIHLDFGFAKHFAGRTYLRFDDTNPATEEKRFMEEIEANVNWLGYSDYRITHSSDYFDELYEFALKMVHKGLAYVCHMSKEQMRGTSSVPESPWRNRSTQENLDLFKQMRQGAFNEGEATLRLKYTMEDGKVDPVAYRINFTAHPRTGTKWCIYPSYDFSHPLVDSLEDISHSMCTKEFQSHRSFYYWMCNTLDIYCPVQWEFGRLNVTHTITSKRKIQLIIHQGTVQDWDDPRLFTISALRRRGIPRSTLYRFSESNSITVANSFISPMKLESFARNDLKEMCPRAIAILRPLKARIVNFEYLHANGIDTTHEFYDFPERVDKGKCHSVVLKEQIFIDAKDCDPDSTDGQYLRLKRGTKVGLMFTKLQLELAEGARIDPETNSVDVRISLVEHDALPRVYIHWLTNPLISEVRLFKNLFLHEYPEKPEYGGFLNDVNPENIERIENAYVERRLAHAKYEDRYQFLREGYFFVDKDSTNCKLVFNLTVGLKENWIKSKEKK